MDDFYDLLGVSEDASPADVKRAWRGKAREYHPDVNDDARAGVQFKTLRAAYEVLSDETKRAAYDRMGHERYVAERLDGLPTAGATRRDDGGGRWRKRAAATGADSDGRSATADAESARSGSNESAASTNHAGSAGARTAGRTRGTGRSRAESTGRSQSTTGPAQPTAGSSRSDATGSANRSTRTGGPGGSAESVSSSAAASTAAVASAPQSLWYAWVASLLAGVAYLGGLAVYLRVNAAALSSLAAAVEASPASALLADAGLVAPGAFALGAVGSAPGPALAFPLGAALLAAVFVAFAVRFRHGSAGLSLYLYPLGALAPLASLALGPVVAASAAGLTLALVAAVPVLAVIAFLVDVGWTLFAPN